MRPSGRASDELRAVRFTRNFTRHAEGSVLVEFGGSGGYASGPIAKEVARVITETWQIGDDEVIAKPIGAPDA